MVDHFEIKIRQLFCDNIDKIKNGLLNIMEKLVTSGRDRQLKSLGVYILGSLTLVSTDAAASMRIYETFRY